jgi:beta-glucosidase
VRLRNSGARAGKEVVQLYAARPDSTIDRPVRWLIGFAVVRAAAGDTVTATITVPPRVWQHWSDAGWTTEAGRFTVSAGRSVTDLPLTTTVSIG